MNIQFETKYAPGDTVFMLTHWHDKIIVRQRTVKSITQAGVTGVHYELEPIGSVLFDHPRPESTLYPTEADAIAAGTDKQREYHERYIESITKELASVEERAKERIEGIRRDLRTRKAELHKELAYYKQQAKARGF